MIVEFFDKCFEFAVLQNCRRERALFCFRKLTHLRNKAFDFRCCVNINHSYNRRLQFVRAVKEYTSC